MKDIPLSEQYRIAALDWVDKDSAARILEESKTAILAQWISEHGDIPVSRAENKVKASDKWFQFLDNMVSTRSEANKAKIQVEYIRMRFSEEIGRDANYRIERKLG